MATPQPLTRPLNIAHYGPPGLLADTLPSCLEGEGHKFMGSLPGSGHKPEPSHLLTADVVLLWVAPQPPSMRLLDEMYAVLAVLEQAEPKPRQQRRVVLISNLLSWASCPTLRESYDGDDADASEDNYLDRRCWPSCEGLMALEAHVMRLDGPKLHTCVIATGVNYGIGEESFFKLVCDARNLVAPLVIPTRGNNWVPSVHTGVLCAFLCWLLDLSPARFPKPYMIACEPWSGTLADVVVAIVEEWRNRATAGALVSDTGTEAINGTGPDLLRCCNSPLEGCELSFAYPASVILALDCTGLRVTGGVFDEAVSSMRIRPFTSVDGSHGGLLGNITEVIDEFLKARGLTFRRIWVLRQADGPPELQEIAKFISQWLQLPCINAQNSVQWVLAHSQQHFDSAAPQGTKISKDIWTNPESVHTNGRRAYHCHQNEILTLQDEIKEFSTELPSNLVSKCIRLRLLDPHLAIHGYVLDGNPASPVSLRQIFEDVTPSPSKPNSDTSVSHCPFVRIAPALAPSKVVVLQATAPANANMQQPSGELEEWLSMQGLDWRFGGEAVQPDIEPMSLIPSLINLFDGMVQPLSINATEITEVGESPLQINPSAIDPGAEEIPWWDKRKRTNNPHCLPTVRWQHLLVAYLRNEAEARDATALDSYQSPEVALSLLERDGGGRIGSYKHPVQCDSDSISREDHDEIHTHSKDLTNVMLEVVRLDENCDKIGCMAAKLAEGGQQLEHQAHAHAYLRYRSSLAKLQSRRSQLAE